ncbi:MAG: hypothetical protein M1833_003447 [Piccolia ochrophora]|nr:MAG: hypothetical protein M1833_003447 [Piccolia ochrophora]
MRLHSILFVFLLPFFCWAADDNPGLDEPLIDQDHGPSRWVDLVQMFNQEENSVKVGRAEVIPESYMFLEFSATESEPPLRVGIVHLPLRPSSFFGGPRQGGPLQAHQMMIRVVVMADTMARPVTSNVINLGHQKKFVRWRREVYPLGQSTLRNDQILDRSSGKGLLDDVWSRNPVYRTGANDNSIFLQNLARNLFGNIQLPDAAMRGFTLAARYAVAKGENAAFDDVLMTLWMAMGASTELRSWRYSLTPVLQLKTLSGGDKGSPSLQSMLDVEENQLDEKIPWIRQMYLDQYTSLTSGGGGPLNRALSWARNKIDPQRQRRPEDFWTMRPRRGRHTQPPER